MSSMLRAPVSDFRRGLRRRACLVPSRTPARLLQMRVQLALMDHLGEITVVCIPHQDQAQAARSASGAQQCHLLRR